MIVEGLVVAAAVTAAYAYRKKLVGIFGKELNIVAAKGSAFARVAEQEGKLIALKASSEVKKEAALAAHKALDEIDELLG